MSASIIGRPRARQARSACITFRALHEAVVRRHAPRSRRRAPRCARESAAVDLGHGVGDDREQHDLLVQHLVVLEVVQQHVGRPAARRGHEHRGARHAVAACCARRRARNSVERQRLGGDALAEQRAAALPGRHDGEDAGRRPRAGTSRRAAILAELAAKNARSNARNSAEQRAGARRAPVPALARDDVEEHRRDRHRAGDRDAVGAARLLELAEAEHQRHARDHQQPVDLGDVDLPLGLARGVDDGDARQVAELHRLAG